MAIGTFLLFSLPIFVQLYWSGQVRHWKLFSSKQKRPVSFSDLRVQADSKRSTFYSKSPFSRRACSYDLDSNWKGIKPFQLSVLKCTHMKNFDNIDDASTDKLTKGDSVPLLSFPLAPCLPKYMSINPLSFTHFDQHQVWKSPCQSQYDLLISACRNYTPTHATDTGPYLWVLLSGRNKRTKTGKKPGPIKIRRRWKITRNLDDPR